MSSHRVRRVRREGFRVVSAISVNSARNICCGPGGPTRGNGGRTGGAGEGAEGAGGEADAIGVEGGV